MSQFSDRPFAVGSMFGIRSFRVRTDGTLTGVVHQGEWHAGINEGKCSNINRVFAHSGQSTAELSWTISKMAAAMTGKVYLKKRPKPREPEPHTISQLGCTCGYYGYFHNAYNPHHHPGNVLGIVEGFGVMTVGTRGFRCSKARIRALIADPTTIQLGPQYDGIPRFATAEDALVEFPLTVPEGTPEPTDEELMVTALGPGYVTFTMTVDTRGFSEMFRRMAQQIGAVPTRRFRVLEGDTQETPRERALRLRRERNTGPADPRGLDGRKRAKGVAR